MTSSRMVVRGNSGPYLSFLGSPSFAVTGLAVPYGLPRLFKHTTKNLETSKALPLRPSRGPHQSPTSALPVRAWHMIMALSAPGDKFPRVVYATGTLRRVTPDSKVNSGMIAIRCSGMRAAKGFSGCVWILSWKYSATDLSASVWSTADEGRPLGLVLDLQWQW